MNQPKPTNHDEHAAAGDHMLNEADIGSGEGSPAKQEIDEEIKSIPKLPENGGQGKDGQPPAAK